MEKDAGEERVYGLHACRALFARRPQDVRKVYVDEARLGDVKDLLRFCAKSSLAYKVVGPGDLERITRSRHHEGLVLLARPPAVLSLEELVASLAPAPAPARLVLLESVRDPHNVGAIVRTAAHFGASAVLLAGESARRSGALLRTAEGGAEALALVPLQDGAAALGALKGAGFTALATSSHAARSLHTAPLPQRALWLFGAEREGLSRGLARAADLEVSIPGTGAVESLNVAAAVAVALAEQVRQSAPEERVRRGSASRQRAQGKARKTKGAGPRANLGAEAPPRVAPRRQAVSGTRLEGARGD